MDGADRNRQKSTSSPTTLITCFDYVDVDELKPLKIVCNAGNGVPAAIRDA